MPEWNVNCLTTVYQRWAMESIFMRRFPMYGGGTIKSRSITLNGCDFPVTENLHTALLYLRNRQLERTLWVDAISIDQDKQDEKARQIPLMRTIYAQAQHVIVWLGEATENGDKQLKEFVALHKNRIRLQLQIRLLGKTVIYAGCYKELGFAVSG